MAKELLETPRKLDEQFSNVELLKYAVEQKKAEFQALQGKITQYKTQLASLEQRLITVESEHKQKLLLEKQNFEREKQAQQNEMSNRFDTLQKAEADYARRKTELEVREAQVEKRSEDNKKLLDERLRYENLNNQAQLRFNEANNLFGEAVKKMDEAAKIEKEADDKLIEVKNTQSIIDNQREDLLMLNKDTSAQIENLNALRKEINPKIDELKSLIIQQEKKLAEIAQEEQGLKDRIEEDDKLMSAIQEREKRVKNKELELATKEQELLRKEVVFNNLKS